MENPKLNRINISNHFLGRLRISHCLAAGCVCVLCISHIYLRKYDKIYINAELFGNYSQVRCLCVLALLRCHHTPNHKEFTFDLIVVISGKSKLLVKSHRLRSRSQALGISYLKAFVIITESKPKWRLLYLHSYIGHFFRGRIS